MPPESSETTRSVVFDRPATGGFRLTRFFSIASLIGILVVTACLFLVFRKVTDHHLLAHESRANANLAQAFSNAVWQRYRSFVLSSAGRTRQALLADPVLGDLHRDVVAQMTGLKVAKVKIYNEDGLTVYSTDPRQIGERKPDNGGILAAREGEVASLIIHRDRFDSFEGEISDRNLIASYVPIRARAAGPVEGIVEVYSDVTELLAGQRQAQMQVAALVFVLLATLYVFLFLLVRKADGLLAAQERERALHAESVRHQAYHDPLTGLPNRASFTDRLGETLAYAARFGHTCAVLYIDLDRFKLVNDSLGHSAGDALLKMMAKRIGACIRGADTLFRIGGDEFTVVLRHIASAEDAGIIARRVVDAVERPATLYEREVTVGATIGIAVYPEDGRTTETLLQNADAAMYSIKDRGRGGYAFYCAAMNQRALQRLELEAEIKKAVGSGEFCLYYQPRVDSSSRRVVALEVLLRWLSPTRGIVGPDDFIDVLEGSGMMNAVGEWVLRSAAAQVRRWWDQGLPAVRVSINVSAVQFESADFAATVGRVLSETNAPPEAIELELTESMLISNPEQARSTIDALRRLGIRISIDDFGTGYSSLNYLRLFPVDILKIDRSFVVGIVNSERDRAVARAIIDLAKALHVTVVAEGVETEAQAEFLAGLQCGELQGYLFCQPVPADEAGDILQGAAPPRMAGAVRTAAALLGPVLPLAACRPIPERSG